MLLYTKDRYNQIESANLEWRNGDTEACAKITDILNDLTGFYPGHIQIEDQDFFKPAMNYFSDKEKKEMMEKEEEFDRDFTHKVYQEKIDKWSEK